MKELIDEITLYMRANTDRELSIEALADKYGYSKYHFSREFKKSIGVTPNEYWAAIKIEQSLLELERSDSIVGAHLKTGYQSTGTFTTAFKNATGFTPGEYKDEIRHLNLWSEAKEYEGKSDKIYTHYSFNRKDPSAFQEHKLYVRCHLPENFKGLLFLGMFTTPLPNKPPMIGKASGTNVRGGGALHYRPYS